MKIDILDLNGQKKGTTELPTIFSQAYRPDIIKRAFLAFTSGNFQAQGAYPFAGQNTSARSWGTGAGRSIMPRIKAGPRRAGRNAKGHRYRSKGRGFNTAGRYAVAPGTVGGRQAHPPKAAKNLIKKVNNKELEIALFSSIAATANPKLVKDHGHRILENQALPFVVEDNIENLNKTKDVLDMLNKLGLTKEIERCTIRKIRSGRGKTRGRKYKTKKGPLFITSAEAKLLSSAKNITGVQAISVENLNIELLAPGTKAGRLTIWSKSAIEKLSENKEDKK